MKRLIIPAYYGNMHAIYDFKIKTNKHSNKHSTNKLTIPHLFLLN